jgi:hypothetical protein
MATEYELTLAPSTPLEQLAERALPDAADRPVGAVPRLVRDLDEKYGFDVTVSAGEDAYLAVESDQGLWEWEPDAYASVTFRLDKFADPAWKVINVLTVVRRVLDTGPEDAALVLNDDILLLTRLQGKLTKHRASWWHNYPAADQLIPG